MRLWTGGARHLLWGRSIRLLRLASCWCILAFTRNPFPQVVMVARYNIRHRRIHKGFRVFQKTFAPTSLGFACSRVSCRLQVAGFFGFRGPGISCLDLPPRREFASAGCYMSMVLLFRPCLGPGTESVDSPSRRNGGAKGKRK